jgi:hypothetical protein
MLGATMALLFRFRRNFLLKVLTDVITKGLMFLFALLVARGLRSEGFGAFSSAQSVAAIVAILSDLGLNTLVTREIAARRGHAPSLVGNLLALKILLSMGVLLILGALTLTGTYADLALPLMLSGAFMVLWSTLEFFSSVVCGFERMEWETALKGGGRLLVVAGGGGALARRCRCPPSPSSSRSSSGWTSCCWRPCAGITARSASTPPPSG